MLEKSISVLIIAKKRDVEVQKCIDSVNRSAYYSLPASWTFEVLFSSKGNKSQARNALAKKAKGDILIFIDSDAEASDFWLHELLKPFQDRDVAVVGGPHLPRSDASYRELLADKILGFQFATFKSSSRYKVSGILRKVDESELSSCNLAIRKDAFRVSGGFPENIIPCEENVVLERIQALGGVMIYNPLAIVFHSRDPLFRPYLRKMYGYGYGRGLMIRAREGRIRFIPGLSKDLIYLFIGFILHYGAYLYGVLKGVFKKDE